MSDMNNSKGFMDKVEEYYLECENNIKKNLEPDLVYDYKFDESPNHDPIVSVYKDDKHLLSATYEILGVYSLVTSVWYWSWNSSMVSKKLTNYSCDIKKFSKYIKSHIEDFLPQESEKLYYYTHNGNFFVSQINVPDIVKLSLYITKSPWFIPRKESANMPEKIEYLIIKKIIQKT